MAQYNFVSPGAMAQNAIMQLFQRRAEDERQAILDEAERQRRATETRQRDDQIALQRQQEARIAQAQADAQADLENQRAFLRANTIAEHALPGDAVDEETASLLRAQGFGSQMRRGQPTQGAYLGDDEQMIPQYDVIPGIPRDARRYAVSERTRRGRGTGGGTTGGGAGCGRTGRGRSPVARDHRADCGGSAARHRPRRT